MSAGLAIKPHEAAKMGETLLAESNRLAAENAELKEKNAKNEAELAELKEKYEAVKEFTPLLDDNAPTAIQVHLGNGRIVRKLMVAALKMYGREGQHPDEIQENETLRRRARMNFQTIVEACVDYGCGDGWNTVRSRYIKSVKI